MASTSPASVLSLSDFSQACRQALSATMATSSARGHGTFGVADMLLVLAQSSLDAQGHPTPRLALNATPVGAALLGAGLNASLFGKVLVDMAESAPRGPAAPDGRSMADSELGQALQSASRWGVPVPVEAMWASLLESENISRLLPSLGLSYAARAELMRSWGLDSPEEDPTDPLVIYGTDLVAQARSGVMDPVVGRDEERRDIMDILQRRANNNPLLVGEHGVGKSALIRGLAQAMASGAVPELLQDHQLWAPDPERIIQGVKSRADIETRVRTLLEAIEANGRVVLVLDDLPSWTASGSDQALILQTLRPAINAGRIRFVGSSTTEAYRQHLEKDPVWSRALQLVNLEEPSIEDSIDILRAVKDKYEKHHDVAIDDDAVITAVQLTARYVGDRRLPAKAFDILDAAAARVRTTLDSRPEVLDRLDRDLARLRAEHAALLRRRTDAGQLTSMEEDRLKAIASDTQRLDKEVLDVSGRWTTEQGIHRALQVALDQQASVQESLDTAISESNLDAAAGYRVKDMPAAAQAVRAARTAVRDLVNPLVHDRVGSNEVAEVLARRTGIPVAKMQGGERERLSNLEEIISAQVIGQDAAVTAISDSVRRARSGLADPEKPNGSFLLLGPTGVGKTEVTKILAKTLFDQADALVRIDMSEFMEKHAVSRLIGAPPGYVGYEEGGVLTEAVRQHPYCVVLLDEMEKAHPDVFNILLQVLDEGHLTDSQGHLVDFRNTVIIMTSNLGSDVIQKLVAAGAPMEEIKEAVHGVVAANMRPELINRIDELVVFNPLGLPEIRKIAEIKTQKVLKNLAARGVKATITKEAVDTLADLGFDPTMGARPLNRAIQQHLENGLARALIRGEVGAGGEIKIDAENGTIVFHTVDPKLAASPVTPARPTPSPVDVTQPRIRNRRTAVVKPSEPVEPEKPGVAKNKV